ncbi:hypothetical protein [Kitasatospora sp. NPDC059673]|uniref:hypothetical protein n=1 Tax=Kitasatospora sp. NPDC059673 TaxID=3346901 RepID=UPI0036C99362
MSGRLAVTLAAAALAVTGCTADKQQAAPVGTAAPGPACSAEPSPTMSAEGSWSGPLPDEIRCLPHVLGGIYSYLPTDLSSTRPGATTLTVDVTDGTTRDQTRALCLRITALGYTPGGEHHIDVLTVRGPATYRSLPGLPACRP